MTRIWAYHYFRYGHAYIWTMESNKT